jgi:choline dehydrogenase-like flavoprotein
MPIDFSLFAAIPEGELAPRLASDGQSVVEHPMLVAKRGHHMSLVSYYPLHARPVLYPSINDDGAYISITALHMLPLSRGTVTLRSKDPGDHPVCDPKFFSTETDRFIMRSAIRGNLRLVETEPLADEIEGEVAPIGFSTLTSHSSDEEIDERVRAFAVTIAHPMGTCALGSVLNDEFRLKGASGLRVCDASVFPEPVGAMPSCTVYALAEMCAELVAGR